ncbi:hypothetical protein [Microbulbifer sediminum]|uniref:hypothetical protein n=1 Tax=Microbulbifer sediminum TaxID=2904250 RepID=UPI001F334FD7|nr:hypothetical protein [Microbulbifer sediminum]
MPEHVGKADCPFSNVFLLSQPGSSQAVAVRFDYRLPKNCVAHHAQFRLTNSEGSSGTILWLETAQASNNGVRYMMNTLDASLIENGLFLFQFSDGRWPVCTNQQYEVYLRDYPIT